MKCEFDVGVFGVSSLSLAVCPNRTLRRIHSAIVTATIAFFLQQLLRLTQHLLSIRNTRRDRCRNTHRNSFQRLNASRNCEPRELTGYMFPVYSNLIQHVDLLSLSSEIPCSKHYGNTPLTHTQHVFNRPSFWFTAK